MYNDVIDKIVAETIEKYNFRMRLDDPTLMEQGTDELLERIANGMQYVAHSILKVRLEDELAAVLAKNKKVSE